MVNINKYIKALLPRGGTPYVMGDTYVPRFWPPFFTLAGSSTIFLGYFSHPPTAKLSFGVQKLPIFTKIDLFGPKFNFFLDLFGSNFQRPAAHPHQPSTPPPPRDCREAIRLIKLATVVFCKPWSESLPRVTHICVIKLNHQWIR